MAGGLLQIVSAGKEDIFLTIDPQITFFKTVYLRYSNFAIETLEETFDGFPNFGEEVTCNISKNGDLIYHMYLKIQLPKVLIPKPNTSTPPSVDTTTLQNFDTFSKPLFSLWRKLYTNITNITSIQSIIDTFITTDEYQLYTPYRNQFNFDLIQLYNLRFKTQYANSIYDPNENNIFKSTFKQFLLDFKFDAIQYKQSLIDSIKSTQTNNNKIYSNYYEFAWVQQIGYRLIDKITFELGGQVIDTLTSDMLNIWNQLSSNVNHQEVINKMIGNVNTLTEYTSDAHPAYTLYIPIPFWFSKYHGAAFPSLALRYHDIQVTVRFKDIYDCCFFPSNANVNLAEQIQLVHASLMIDYVYLDMDEKNKYANSNLEYLIEQHQYLTFSDINIKNFNTSLTFVNPVKEIFWIAQSQKNMREFKQWDKYNDLQITHITGFSNDVSNNRVRITASLLDTYVGDKIQISNSKFYNGIHPIVAIDVDYVYIKTTFVGSDTGFITVLKPHQSIFQSMQLINNGVELTPKTDSTFFNHLVTYKKHTNSPLDAGIFLYSYALHPELFQPTGSCNMSLLTSNDIYFTIRDNVIQRLRDSNDTIVVKTIATSMNILSVNKGYSYLEFSA